MLKPLSDYVVLESLKEEVKKGGIILPESSNKSGAEQGKVVAFGPGSLNEDGDRIPLQVKKGDVVVFNSSYGTQKIKLDGKEYIIVRESEIVAIID